MHLLKSQRLSAIAAGTGGVLSVVLLIYALITDELYRAFIVESLQRELGRPFPWPVRAALAVVLISASIALVVQHQEQKTLQSAVKARADARANAVPAIANERLQERAVDLHVARLTSEIVALRRRAFGAFLPGVLLCVGAVAGPWIAVELASAHPEHWQYMLGGSATALVLLGAGSALLRHDAKLHEQLLSSKSELLYFSRIQTGLDCARALGVEEYTKSLALITAHLLAAPPSLVAPKGTQPSDDKKSEPSATTKTENDNAERLAFELLRDAVNAKAGKA